MSTGQGDITSPQSWSDGTSIPPSQFSNVPQNVVYPLNGDGRYWWTGNVADAMPGPISFVGDTAYYKDSMQLGWQIANVATDGSSVVLSYSLDGGTTWIAATLNDTFGPPVQHRNLLSGAVNFSLAAATGLKIKVTTTGGSSDPTAKKWEVAVAVTRNANSQPVWDFPNPFNPINYNGSVVDAPPYDTLGTLINRMLIRLGFANQLEAPPPGMQALLQEFLQSSQNFLYKRFSQLRTRRWFRWKINPNQRFYSLLDNDDNVLEGFNLDTDKVIEYVAVQDTRNVWYPLIEGVPPQLYTMLEKPWRPSRYKITNCIELYPAPDQTYYLWVFGHFGLQAFATDDDITTIDSELVFLHALANAKAHYGQPDANNIEVQANAMRQQLVAATHQTARYVPGTIAVPPAVRPTLIRFSDGSGQN